MTREEIELLRKFARWLLTDADLLVATFNRYEGGFVDLCPEESDRIVRAYAGEFAMPLGTDEVK